MDACQNHTFDSNKTTKETTELDNQKVDLETTGFIKVDGIELVYKIEGQGIPILVLNESAYYPTFSNKLRENCQFIFVETRCFLLVRQRIGMNFVASRRRIYFEKFVVS